ncbi:hypothetical protein PSN45_000909 [Yamadazyma tenuis]|uniref:SWIRM-domain-containing protein n=1 Tax=Candida tenuis (strain ATCC 10573 / BCRC 21748 / CBS 615 / JCM 9827 / NBRC 10315 / NRRL Y-1498 / VKM Y-70) TaxID=590646 RepID=G3BBH0_CANTC|nr:SWIRM-domain-containing protein [Yamadazyma tenuis ATCC 10573]EGV62190.1 SWIRM-domain-containing protein [Yamadazyma tenuis ATCC 10573]WEJ93446.1 hypothetical protein PSN45_000909 [Yamadazyma tenuis]
MSTIYHPSAKSISSRLDEGCLTPQNPQLEAKSQRIAIATSSSSHNKPNQLDILSPPLSPYQRTDSVGPAPVAGDQALIRSYLPNKPFSLENYNNYDLKVNPWTNLNNDYRARQFAFLKKYSIIKKKETDRYLREKAGAKKRKYNTNGFMGHLSDSNSNSDNGSNKVRTRRIIKESNNELTDKLPTRSSSPASSPKKRKPNIQQQQQSFIDENIPDYSPELSTLPNNAKCMKIDWKGQPMDLSGDPNTHKLHPAEVTLASVLRLPCNVYLDSKRRLFYEKVNRLRAGMQFRRTDAQKACRIDVNKASRLFAAFEKVGWLDDHHFDRYL